jgi:hypothetical protein
MNTHLDARHLQIRILPNVIFLGKLSEMQIVLGSTNTQAEERNMPNTIPHVLETVLLEKNHSNVRLVVKDILTEVI